MLTASAGDTNLRPRVEEAEEAERFLGIAAASGGVQCSSGVPEAGCSMLSGIRIRFDFPTGQAPDRSKSSPLSHPDNACLNRSPDRPPVRAPGIG